MKFLSVILLIFFAGCIPYVPPPSPKYVDKIKVTFTNQVKGDFYIQIMKVGGWQNVLILRGMNVGNHVDTINYVSGLYRIITVGDSTNIFPIK